VTHMMVVCPGPSIGRLPGGSSADAGSWAAREHAITGYVYGKRD
jgi:hypothetical protein